MSQFDKNDVETAGLVKFDFLGLRTLTIIDWAVKMINERQGEAEPVPLMPCPWTMSRCTGSCKRGNHRVIPARITGDEGADQETQASSFEDIIALVALFRPGPLQSGMVDDFIERKHGRTEVAYPHLSWSRYCPTPTVSFSIRNR